MSTILAINITETDLSLLMAERVAGGFLRLAKYRTVILSADIPAAGEEATSTTEEVETDQIPLAEPTAPSVDKQLLTNLGIDADTAIATLSGNRVFYRKFALPFNDQKKLDQIAPLQLQDLVPFDLDNFLLDNSVLGEQRNGEYHVLSTAIHEQEVERALFAVSRFGIDPKILTTRASSLSAVAALFTPALSGTFALLEVTDDYCSLAVFVNDELQHLREFSRVYFRDGEALPQLFSAINSSLSGIEREFQTRIENVHVLGPERHYLGCRQSLNSAVSKLDVSSIIAERDDSLKVWEENPWAFSLIAAEINKGNQPLVDFRKGRFAHNPVLKNLWAAIKEELFPIALALIFAVGWYFSVIYNANKSLALVDEKIKEAVVSVAPGENIPYRQELPELEKRVSNIEEQLQEIGSLSSLSPLDSIKELSSAIGTSIDVEIESLSIGSAGLNFRGSAVDNPAIGRLSEALKTKRFCDVNATPMGKSAGSSRVSFSAEIKLCE